MPVQPVSELEGTGKVLLQKEIKKLLCCAACGIIGVKKDRTSKGDGSKRDLPHRYSAASE